ncbi:MAG: RpiB/LacA/LacB family sugar-phosphate isomerase [Candidatus Micrarchaeia archaeon]
MKILMLSNVPGGLDTLVGELSAQHNIVAREIGVSTNELAERVANELSTGYDVCIVVAKDPVGLGILLNKKEGIAAAVCNSPNDVYLGRSNNANVFIISSSKGSNIEDMAAALSKLGYSKNFFVQGLSKVLAKKPALFQPQNGNAGKKQKQPQESEQEEDEEEQGGKGIVGKIKSALGIV